MTPTKVEVLADLSRALSTPAFDLEIFMETYRSSTGGENRSEFLARLFGGREGSIDADPDNIFCAVLNLLWEDIVKPMLEVLNLQVSKQFVALYSSLCACRNQLIHHGYGGAQLALLLSSPFTQQAYITKILQTVPQIMWFHPIHPPSLHCSTLLLALRTHSKSLL
jgi:hypothetical protein